MKDKIRASQCADCGKFMDKVEVTVQKQLAKGGTVKVGGPYIGWVCPDPKCNQKKP
jgi:hypothetical protein